MTAGSYDIIIEQGATFQLALTWTDSAGVPINITGYTARMMVRADYYATAALLSLTSPGDIVLGGAAGTIAITASAAVTAALAAGVGVYDVELVSAGGLVYRVMQGKANITPEATK